MPLQQRQGRRELSIKDELKRECIRRAKKISTTIYGICYADGNRSIIDDDNNVSNKDDNVNVDVDLDDMERYIVACSSTGIICIWDTMADVTNMNTNTDTNTNTKTSRQLKLSSKHHHDPLFSFKVCNGILYDVKFIPQYTLSSATSSSLSSSSSSSSSLLITCGECGVFVFKWEDILRHSVAVSFKKSQKGISSSSSGGGKNKNKNNSVIIQPISIMSPNPLVRTSMSILSSSGPSTTQQGQQQQQQQQQQQYLFPTAPIPPTEVNCISYDDFSGYLYGACGGITGGYIWDISTSSILGTLQPSNHDYEYYEYSSGSSCVRSKKRQRQRQRRRYNHHGSCHTSSYLHTIKAVSSSNYGGGSSGAAGSHLILTGSDSGYVGLWNGKNQKLIEMIDCKTALMECFSNNNSINEYVGMGSGGTYLDDGDKDLSTTLNGESYNLDKNSSLWVSNIDVDNLCQRSVIGGGIDHCNGATATMTPTANGNGNMTNKKNIHNSGYLALMDMQTRTVNTCCTTRENVNDVAYHPTSGRVVSVGNHNIVSFWKSDDLTTSDDSSSNMRGSIARSWISSPSAYSIAIQKRRIASLANGSDSVAENYSCSPFFSPLMSIGGVGCDIDCYAHYGTKSSTMKFCP